MRTATLLLVLCLCFMKSRAQQQTVGLFTHTKASQDGYVLFAPLYSKKTYLIDKCGLQVHSWNASYTPANSVYLLQDGSLLHTGNANNPVFPNGGYVEKLDWNSNVTWSYLFPGGQQSQHHDVCALPNGNVLALVWEIKSRNEAIQEGRDTALFSATVWTEKVVELEPAGANNARIVWEWSVWDHLVQDRDAAAKNYGSITDHPELVNVNYNLAPPKSPDWLHTNGIAYNAALDQIMISVYWMNELWIIDHSTTTAEAAAHLGGKYGKGGDLLYRWGNPQAYGRGTAADQKLFRLHNAHWIPAGVPDAGKILVFNNGQQRPDSDYSSVDVIAPPVDAAGNYMLNGAAAYGPQSFSWEYKAPVETEFFAPILSGAQRLENGNTLICEASKGNFIEVDPAGAIVWKYINPVDASSGPVAQGAVPDQNLVFRSVQYPASYPGFTGRTLIPGAPVEQNPLANYDCYPGTPLQAANIQPANRTFSATNPFSDNIGLGCSGAEAHVQASLIDCMGAVCGSWELAISGGRPASIQIPYPQSAGMYFLRIIENGKQTVLKLRHN
jgi:hypothetical protein